MKGFTLALCFVLCAMGVFAQVGPQLDRVWGHYFSECRAYGDPSSGIYAKHMVFLQNSGFYSRVEMYVQNPQCNNPVVRVFVFMHTLYKVLRISICRVLMQLTLDSAF